MRRIFNKGHGAGSVSRDSLLLRRIERLQRERGQDPNVHAVLERFKKKVKTQTQDATRSRVDIRQADVSRRL